LAHLPSELDGKVHGDLSLWALALVRLLLISDHLAKLFNVVFVDDNLLAFKDVGGFEARHALWATSQAPELPVGGLDGTVAVADDLLNGSIASFGVVFEIEAERDRLGDEIRVLKDFEVDAARGTVKRELESFWEVLLLNGPRCQCTRH
jgi:hypothetical protein